MKAERDIEALLRDGVKKLGGRAYKWVSPGNAGVPDRIVILPGMQPIFVELKSDTGRLLKVQKLQIKVLRNLGQIVEVIQGEDEVRDFLDHAKAFLEREIR